MYQTAQLPDNAETLTLSFNLNIDSHDSLLYQHDSLDIFVQDSTGNYLGTVASYANTEKLAFSSYGTETFDLTSYLDRQTIRIFFQGATDNINTTTFRIDNVSLKATPPYEPITEPDPPAGVSEGIAGISYTFTSANAGSSNNHELEYRFDWGDGSYSDWSTSTTKSHTWSAEGVYSVKAEARCNLHFNATAVSSGLNVNILVETISAPETPSGKVDGYTDIAYVYSCASVTSNLNHPIEYRFMGSDGIYSEWSASPSAPHNWNHKGTYNLNIQTRCAIHKELTASSDNLIVHIKLNAPDFIVSALSGPTSGVIDETVVIPAIEITNQGVKNADKPFNFAYYLSSDPVINIYDLQLAPSVEIASLAAGASTTIATAEVSLPSFLNPGTYYLGAVVDNNETTPEVDESNNSCLSDSGPIILTGTSDSAPPPIIINEASGEPSATNSGGGNDSKKFCFIATAAYGSYLHPHVKALRKFRDQYLLTNYWGRIFVANYYKYSPPIADYIHRHDTLRALTRFLLTPLVFGVLYPETSAFFTILFLFMTIFMARRRRRAKRIHS